MDDLLLKIWERNSACCTVIKPFILFKNKYVYRSTCPIMLMKIVLVLNFEIELSSFRNIRLTFVNVKSAKRELHHFFFKFMEANCVLILINIEWPVSETWQIWFYQVEENLKGLMRILGEGYVNVSVQGLGIWRLSKKLWKKSE